MALAELYDQYAPIMLAVGIRMLKVRSEAEDVVQETFVELWKRAGDYDPRRGRVKTWIMLRMRSRCLDVLKSARVKRSTSLDAPNVPERAADATAETAVDSVRVRHAMETLPSAHRSVLTLGYFEGLSSSEMAARLDIPIGTVKSRARIALNKLREMLNAGEMSG